MKNIFFIIILFFSSISYAQIRLEFKLDFNSKIADVTIINNSSENYVFPLDINNLRPYEPECANYQEYEDSFPSLGLMLMIENQNDMKLLTYYVEDYVDPIKFDSITKEYKKKKSVYDDSMEKWKKLNKIKKIKDAKINYNIMNNLIFLKPKEKINYKLAVNTNNITNQNFKAYSYLYNSSESYKYYVEYCNASKAYEYLTRKQKKKIKGKGYKLFFGTLKSNIFYNKVK
ncbi:hypothetical protein A0O34_05210 [Chryseobacterium glaciei]|uniref:Uncharacterized protein n=1 Tax=Chryseobacterium glaciei TaxID=1685010 RepID=A0A172XSM1_9FLAO|nr:hypothetical protein [Chryseobacterium glaciei]ANF49961.1 hypothetical protein A0O34_05210 [Chryseobacterium glaciei]